MVMENEWILRVKDNTSENGDDEYLEYQTKKSNYNEKLSSKKNLPFKPYACFHRYEYQENG